MLDASSLRTFHFRSDLRSAATLEHVRLTDLPFLSAEDLAALKACSASRLTVRAGAELTYEGELTDALYFLEDGWAFRYTTTADGRRQISALLLPGDTCNLPAVSFRRTDCNIRMVTAGTVLSASRERIAALAATRPGIAQAFAWLGFVEHAILSRRTLCLGRLSARERLAHLLCELAVRLGYTESAGKICFEMPITQEHLADVLGLTPVHVNRTMQQLRSEGLLISTKRTTTICDVAKMRRTGEFQPGYLHAADFRD